MTGPGVVLSFLYLLTNVMKYYRKGRIYHDNKKYRRNDGRCRRVAHRFRAAAHLETPLAPYGGYSHRKNERFDDPRNYIPFLRMR